MCIRDRSKCAALGDFCKGTMDGTTLAEDGSLDLFIGTGNRFHGTDNRLFQNAGDATGTDSPFDTNANHAFIQLMSYDPMPGNERGYGFDFADYDADGAMDAVQTSRGYDFLVNGLLQGT